MVVPKARPYQSDLRARQAARTREEILEAALQGFLDTGYAATTIAQIAQSAGVSAQTVYAHFGSKPGIARELIPYTNARTGATELAGGVIGAPTPLAMFAASIHLVCVVHERIGAFIRVLLEAAREDPTLMPAVESGRSSHRKPQAIMAKRLDAAGALREDLDVDVAAGLLSEWTGPEAIERFVSLLGWSYAEIEERIPPAIAHALCRPGAEVRPWPVA